MTTQKPRPARLHHANVPAHDVRLVANFYSEVLGLTEVEMPVKEGIGEPEQQLVAWFDPGNGQPGLHVVLPRVDFAREHNIWINPITHGVHLTLSPAGPFTPTARLRLEQPANVAGIGTYTSIRTFTSERGAIVVPLGSSTTVVELAGK